MLRPELRRQLLRFGFAGAFVTGMHALVAVTFISLVMPAPAIANGVAFAIATAVSYVINTLWSFSCAFHGRNLFRFLCVSCLGCILAMFVSGAAEIGGLHYGLGIALVACVVPPFTFAMHRFWTYT